MSQTISGNLIVTGSAGVNSLVSSSANVGTLQVNTLNCTNLNGSISALTIPTLTSTNITNSSTIRSQEMFIGPKNIGTSIQTLEDNNVIDKNNILTLQTKTTNISYNSTNLQTSISGDTNINNVNNLLKITNPNNSANITVKPGYISNTVQNASNAYVGTSSSSDTLNVNMNVDCTQTVKGNLLRGNNAIINNVDINNYLNVNNANINDHTSRIVTLETGLSTNTTNLSGITYTASGDLSTIDNNVKVTKKIECSMISVNDQLTYDPTAITNPKIAQGLALGNMDSNNFGGVNLCINSWWSTGFIDTANKKCSVMIDHRTGDIKTTGGVETVTVQASGNIQTSGTVTCDTINCKKFVGPTTIPAWMMNTSISIPRFDKLVPILASTKNLGSTTDGTIGIDCDDMFIVYPGYLIQVFDAINYSGILGAVDNRNGTSAVCVASTTIYNGQNRVASIKVYDKYSVEVTLPLFS